ncbi:MAG: FliA/WhiG family RNA polymerase sigma factor [Anaeromyxobacteraceae bacterium]|nr:FliA/WhiG family RNA polymerase sigma factor [Anaeromyxobacteraceae bacterium]
MNRAVAKYGGASRDAPERELLKRHGPMLDRMARRLSARTGHAVASEDLWAAGAMGLIEASRRFDPSRDVKFETFAEHRVRGAMVDEMRRMDHLPRRLRDDADKVERAHGKLAQQLHREPTVEEVAGAVGGQLEDVMEVMQLLQPAVPVAEEIATSEALPADEQYDQHERRRVLAGAIAELPERLRILLALYYDEALTYREIAKILQVSEPRVCQLHSEAMKRLRESAQLA